MKLYYVWSYDPNIPRHFYTNRKDALAELRAEAAAGATGDPDSEFEEVDLIELLNSMEARLMAQRRILNDFKYKLEEALYEEDAIRFADLIALCEEMDERIDAHADRILSYAV